MVKQFQLYPLGKILKYMNKLRIEPNAHSCCTHLQTQRCTKLHLQTQKTRNCKDSKFNKIIKDWIKIINLYAAWYMVCIHIQTPITPWRDIKEPFTISLQYNAYIYTTLLPIWCILLIHTYIYNYMYMYTIIATNLTNPPRETKEKRKEKWKYLCRSISILYPPYWICVLVCEFCSTGKIKLD